jgi:methyl-accepting chemotaxis protein
LWWTGRTLDLAKARDNADTQARAAKRALEEANAAMAAELDAQSAAVARELVEQARVLQTSAEALLAGQTTALASVQAVEHASGRTARDVETVATAADQLDRTIREVERRMEGSATSGRHVAERAADTTRTMGSLGTAVDAIGDILAMVSGIAEQTNLLALNATIEAARPARRAAALPWSPARSSIWPSRRRVPRKTSPARSKPSRVP